MIEIQSFVSSHQERVPVESELGSPADPGQTMTRLLRDANLVKHHLDRASTRDLLSTCLSTRHPQEESGTIDGNRCFSIRERKEENLARFDRSYPTRNQREENSQVGVA